MTLFHAPAPVSQAEAVDRVVDRLLVDGSTPSVEPSLRPAIEVAVLLRAALAQVPPGQRFEERLAARLAGRGLLGRSVRAIGDLTRRELRHPGRLIVTGAVSTAAVGAGVTALAVWRTSRRQSSLGHRLLHR